MALWRRVERLSGGCRRWYSVLSAASASGSPLPYLNRSPPVASAERAFRLGSGPSPFPCVYSRSFAAPPQAKTKGKPAADASAGTRMNTAITAPFVRLVAEEGHSVVPLKEALDRAKALNLDLVEVQRTANPPVCKIMDFHKEKYKQEIKEKEKSKSKSGVALRTADNKEVRFKAKTEPKDLKIKADQVIRLMERGYRVKCTAMPIVGGGKEEEDLGGLLSRLIALIEDVAIVETGPHVDPSKAYVIVRHIKFGLKKSGKKATKVMEAVGKGVKSALPTSPKQDTSVPAEDEWEPVECSEAEDEALANRVGSSEQELSLETTGGNLKEDWSKLNSRSNLEEIFDFDSNNLSSSGHKDNLPSYGEKKLHQHSSSESAVNGPRFSKPKMEIPKEPSIVETNRYSKRTETRGRSNNFDRSNSLPYNKGAVNQERRGESQRNDHGHKRRLEGATMGRHNDHNLQPQNNGVFNSRFSGDRNDKSLGSGDTGNVRPQSSVSPIFIKSANAPVNQQNNFGNEAVDKSRTPTQAPKFGTFSSTKPAGTVDEKNLDATKAKPEKPSSTAPKYGIFSSSKAS